MNQKQRDLLCKLVETRRESIEKEIRDLYPGISANRYNIEHLSFEQKRLMPPKLGTVFSKLKARAETLRNRQNILNGEWDALVGQLKSHLDEQNEKVNEALERLRDAVNSTVLQIQFADDADTAQNLLDSLPSAKDLVSPE